MSNINFSEIQNLFSRENFITDQSQIENLVTNCIPIHYKPQLVVYPQENQQIQKILSFANRHKVGVWVVSRGKNWGYGSRSPNYDEGILIVLEKMNRILEVNETLGYAVIEPGVSYDELNKYLKQAKSRLWVDPTGSTCDGSVIGNALDKGRGITPYADHFGHLCGMQVILPTGEVMQTDGAGENYQARYSYRWGFGPVLNGLFVQSNLGIVSKAAVWLMPKPEKYEFMTFEYTANLEKFPDFLDTFRELCFSDYMRAHPHIANDFAMLCIIDQHPKGGEALSNEEMSAWRKIHGVNNWTFGCGLYGDSVQVAHQKRKIKKALCHFGKVQFIDFFYKDGLFDKLRKKTFELIGKYFLKKSSALIATLELAHKLYQGQPTDYFVKQAYCLKAQKPIGKALVAEDKCGVIWVGPILPFDGRKINEFYNEAKVIFKKNNFDFFAEVIPTGPRSIVSLMGIFYKKEDPEQVKRANQWFVEFRSLCLQRGYPPYRETLMTLDELFKNNTPYYQTVKKIKAALDPNGILSKGRTGKELS